MSKIDWQEGYIVEVARHKIEGRGSTMVIHAWSGARCIDTYGNRDLHVHGCLAACSRVGTWTHHRRAFNARHFCNTCCACPIRCQMTFTGCAPRLFVTQHGANSWLWVVTPAWLAGCQFVGPHAQIRQFEGSTGASTGSV